MNKPKVIIIVGPTASGKTSLSIALAKECNGEIISADSRQVYRGLDLGTGKVTETEMDGVPHHLLDVADPNETYTVSDYVEAGRKTISEIVARGNLPIIAGGTFFYIDALIGKITLPGIPPNPLLRQELEALDTNTLFALLKAKDPAYAAIIDKDNPHRLVRALEIIDVLGHMPKMESEPLYDTLTLGVSLPKEILHENIHNRLIERLDQGMIEEVENLHKSGLSYERMEDLGLEYRYIARHLQEQLSKEAMLSELETKTRQFAKRQMTWLKRDKAIVWVDKNDIEGTKVKVEEFLNA